MLDRLGHEPVEFIGPALTPLAERVLDHLRHAPGLEFQGGPQSFAEELLRDTDPADLVASLVISLPAITVESCVEGQDIQDDYHSVLSHGLDRLAAMPVGDWRLSDQQIFAALES